MNFSIAGNDPRNTNIVGPGVAYNVQTPGPFMLHTTIRRAGASAAVAQIDWHPLSADILRMGGAETRVDEFLQRSPGRISPERAFVAGGETYTWRLAPSAMTLSRADVPIATVDFRGRHGSMLQVSQDASAVLDELVVSMLLMWRMQQQRPDSHLRGGDDPQLGHRRRGSRAQLSGGHAKIGGWHGGHGAAGALFGGDGDGGWFSNDGGGDGGDGAGGNSGAFEDGGSFGGDGGSFGGDGGSFGGDGGPFGGDSGYFGGDGGYFGGDGGYSGGDGGCFGGDGGGTAGTDC